MDFYSELLLDALLAASDDQLNAESFGVVGMDASHRVVFYNDAESALSGLAASRVQGLHFFTEVAPCTNNYMVAHRFEQETTLDATIDYVFTLRMSPTVVQLRLLQRPEADKSFLLVRCV